jgi:hypothetical protein
VACSPKPSTTRAWSVTKMLRSPLPQAGHGPAAIRLVPHPGALGPGHQRTMVPPLGEGAPRAAIKRQRPHTGRVRDRWQSRQADQVADAPPPASRCIASSIRAMTASDRWEPPGVGDGRHVRPLDQDCVRRLNGLDQFHAQHVGRRNRTRGQHYGAHRGPSSSPATLVWTPTVRR